MSEVEIEVSKSWYVIHTYSGFEQKVKTSLEELVFSLNNGY